MPYIFANRYFILLFLLFSTIGSVQTYAQQDPDSTAVRSDFWRKVQFGGGLGLAMGSGYTDFLVAPGAIYNFNEKFAVGAGLQYSYIKQRDYFDSHMYGASVIGLYSPIPQVQLSLELEQLRVNLDYETLAGEVNDDFWNTGLFVGAGYRAGNVTIGARYNLLFREDRNVYSDAFMPFVRAYF
ncbi:MAG: hypothetical protein ITG00_00425 [Flavobacterium sp.]|nr:hypothetical protein [Flavobacterium sp.]